jgi:hypothetical protein
MVEEIRTCQQCRSPRLARGYGHCSDMCRIALAGKHTHGYVPRDLGVGGGDAVPFIYVGRCEVNEIIDRPFSETDTSEGRAPSGRPLDPRGSLSARPGTVGLPAPVLSDPSDDPVADLRVNPDIRF